MSGPHAPSAVAAQQKLHRSSPAVRAAVARVAQDGRGAGRGSSPIAPCQHRCRCSSHTEQVGVVPSMTDQVLGTANLLGKAPIRRSGAPKTSGNDGEADRRSLHVEMNHYRSEDERHIDIHPSTRALLSLLCHLLRFFGDVLASLLHRRGCLLCHIAQTVSGNPHLLHGLLCRVFHLTGCL